MGPLSNYHVIILRISTALYGVEKHHMKIQKCPINFGDASPDRPKIT